MLKRMIKQGLQAAAWVAGPHRWRRGPCLLVLTYHRVLPEGHPDRAFEQPGMLVTPELLAMHFRTLRHWFMPVHLDDWLKAAQSGQPPPGRSVAITFDDGWQDNYRYAFPVIQAEQMPATLFLVTDMIGTRQRFWPNRLASLLHRWQAGTAERLPGDLRAQLQLLGISEPRPGYAWTAEAIDRVINACKTRFGDAAMHDLLGRLEASQPPQEKPKAEAPDLLTWEQVREMAASGLVRFGSHTRRHTRLLPGLEPAVLEDEVMGSKQAVEAALAEPCPLFCYPNGDLHPAACDLVAEAYIGALATDSGWHRPGDDPLRIRRHGIHEGSAGTPAALLARVSGWPGL